ncbi:MAG: hypothetical protein J6S53_09745 [Lentisphaeria bacterium]|nr:hypothetical protein [Lentisphaeria bacterium]
MPFGKFSKMVRLVVREMTGILALDLVRKRLVTNLLVLNIAYDVETLTWEQLLIFPAK